MQDLLVDWFGSTGATAIRYLVAFLVVVGLLLLLRWVMQTYVSKGSFGAIRGRHNRIAVVDAIAVDPRRRLLLVRRDNVEHLILVGGSTDIVVEPTIIRGVPVGSLGRVGGRGQSAGPVMGERTEAPETTPTEAEPDLTPPQQVPPVARAVRTPPHQAPQYQTPQYQTPQYQTPQHPAPQPPESEPAPQAAPSMPRMRMPERLRPRPTPPTPAPEPEQPAPAAAPYVQQAASRDESVPVAAPASSTAPEKSAHDGFDDLARQLDEALKSDIGGNAPAAAPAPDVRVEAPAPEATPSPRVPPVEPPKAKTARPVIPAASTWLRPRAQSAKAPAAGPAATDAPKASPIPPVVSRSNLKAAAPVVPPVALPIEPTVPTPARVEDKTLEDRLAEALSDNIAAIPPTAEPAAAPEEAPEVKVPDVKPPEAKPQATGDFTSLEDEMARLLDELAGDSKGKR